MHRFGWNVGYIITIYQIQSKWKDDASPRSTSNGCDIGRGDARRVVKQELSSLKKIASQMADNTVLFCFSSVLLMSNYTMAQYKTKTGAPQRPKIEKSWNTCLIKCYFVDTFRISSKSVHFYCLTQQRPKKKILKHVSNKITSPSYPENFIKIEIHRETISSGHREKERFADFIYV